MAVTDKRRDQEQAPLPIGGSAANRPHRVLRIRAVEDRTGLKKSTIYNRIAAGNFPPGFALGGGMRGWLESSIDDWILGTARGEPGKQGN